MTTPTPSPQPSSPMLSLTGDALLALMRQQATDLVAQWHKYAEGDEDELIKEIASFLYQTAVQCKPAASPDMDELLPCCQCGMGDVYLIEDRSSDHEGGVGFLVSHIRLLGAVVPCHINTGWWPTAAEAKECWNRRPTAAPPAPGESTLQTVLASMIDRALLGTMGQQEDQHRLLELADHLEHTTVRTAHYVILGQGDPTLVVGCTSGAFRSASNYHAPVEAGTPCPNCGWTVVAGRIPHHEEIAR